MISHKHKRIFIHIPKMGGAFIENYLVLHHLIQIFQIIKI